MNREELYRYFGPQLLEAIVKLTLEEINALRENAGLPVRTMQQMIDALKARLDETPKYDWMDWGNPT